MFTLGTKNSQRSIHVDCSSSDASCASSRPRSHRSPPSDRSAEPPEINIGKYFESKPCNFSNKQSIKACSCAGFASTKMDGDDDDDDDDGDDDGDGDDDTLLAMASLLPTVKASHY